MPAEIPDDKLLLREQIEEVLPTLSEREQRVLILRFGIGCEMHTLEEIGQLMGGLSRERIRQIEKRALRKVNHPANI